ncbi:hypothetical protein CPB84DRAFT_669427 [Gymnopilus junonius]|uniref:Uncharacterized protein n=1 Tax=Gymnopilus junonius TaxID=109634 RepID=A0A9P5NRS1_GYMJU|nr:hypothetical protein CPB84DRAFT_669427 [Gymnopilus junonius]
MFFICIMEQYFLSGPFCSNYSIDIKTGPIHTKPSNHLDQHHQSFLIGINDLFTTHELCQRGCTKSYHHLDSTYLYNLTQLGGCLSLAVLSHKTRVYQFSSAYASRPVLDSQNFPFLFFVIAIVKTTSSVNNIINLVILYLLLFVCWHRISPTSPRSPHFRITFGWLHTSLYSLPFIIHYIFAPFWFFFIFRAVLGLFTIVTSVLSVLGYLTLTASDDDHSTIRRVALPSFLIEFDFSSVHATILY